MDKLAQPVIVFGATGYIGNRLVPRLLLAGYRVRAIARSLAKLKAKSWSDHPHVELVECDVLDLHSLQKALVDCWAAYYLVHSMNPQNEDFVQADRQAAQNVIEAAAKTSIKRIIYLGGLGEKTLHLSKHLSSRLEVEQILQSGSVPVTVLRAAMIIGSGSASFEILRYLVERLPVMVTPKWVNTPSQPIAIRNVLHYLIGCLAKDETIGQSFDIGGPEILTYRQLMDIYASEAGLHKRLIIPVPVFTPRLSSYWIHLVTPVPAYIARPLAEGLRNPAICRENRIKEFLPQDLFTCRQAIALALNKIQHNQVESSWIDAGRIPPAEWYSPADPQWAGGTMYEDKRKIVINGTTADAWRPIVSLGGSNGWYHADWLWRLRGFIDRMIGGVGLRRGRRHPVDLSAGDALDFWRVKIIEPEKRLVLAAEMKLPGEALLEFRIQSIDTNKTLIEQTARFFPLGLSGIFYWHIISPLHKFLFSGMLKSIANRSEKYSQSKN